MAMPHDEPKTGQPRPPSPVRRASTLLGVQPWEPPAASPHPAPVADPAPVLPGRRPGAASSHKTTLAGVAAPSSLPPHPAHRPRHHVLTSVPTTLGWKPEPTPEPAPDLAALAGSDLHAPLSEPMPDTEPAPARASAPQDSSPPPPAALPALAPPPAPRPLDAGSLDRVSEHDIARAVAVTRFLGAHPVAAITTAVITSACTLYGAYGLVHHLVRIVSG